MSYPLAEVVTKTIQITYNRKKIQNENSMLKPAFVITYIGIPKINFYVDMRQFYLETKF